MAETRFYLGVEVRPIEDHGNGWIGCQWPNGKTWRHWHDQLKREPWGDA